MRILADENISLDTVDALLKNGYDVLWIRTYAPGISDREILALAQIEKRVIITFDKDFGELTFNLKFSALSGIILFRISPSSPTQIVNFIITTLLSRNDWSGHFSVVEFDKIRMKPLFSKDYMN